MEVNLNPSMTVKPQPISVTKPHQFYLQQKTANIPVSLKFIEPNSYKLFNLRHKDRHSL
jgi:hypothetical protein